MSRIQYLGGGGPKALVTRDASNYSGVIVPKQASINFNLGTIPYPSIPERRVWVMIMGYGGGDAQLTGCQYNGVNCDYQFIAPAQPSPAPSYGISLFGHPDPSAATTGVFTLLFAGAATTAQNFRATSYVTRRVRRIIPLDVQALSVVGSPGTQVMNLNVRKNGIIIGGASNAVSGNITVTGIANQENFLDNTNNRFLNLWEEVATTQSARPISIGITNNAFVRLWSFR
jgi:hypothetical protein